MLKITINNQLKYQFLFLSGTLASFCFIAILTDIGIGSNEGLMAYGPIMLVGLIL